MVEWMDASARPKSSIGASVPEWNLASVHRALRVGILTRRVQPASATDIAGYRASLFAQTLREAGYVVHLISADEQTPVTHPAQPRSAFYTCAKGIHHHRVSLDDVPRPIGWSEQLNHWVLKRTTQWMGGSFQAFAWQVGLGQLLRHYPMDCLHVMDLSLLPAAVDQTRLLIPDLSPKQNLLVDLNFQAARWLHAPQETAQSLSQEPNVSSEHIFEHRCIRLLQRLYAKQKVALTLEDWADEPAGPEGLQERWRQKLQRGPSAPLEGSTPDRNANLIGPSSSEAFYSVPNGFPLAYWLERPIRADVYRSFAGRRVLLLCYPQQLPYDLTGMDTLLEALAALRARYPALLLLIVGPLGEDHAPLLQGRLAQWALADHVRFMPEPMDEETINTCLRASELCLWPLQNHWRTQEEVPALFPLLQALGKPLLVSGGLALADRVATRQCGLVFQPKQSASLAEQIASLLENPVLCQQLGASAQQWAQQYANWSLSGGAALRTVYRGLLQPNTPPALQKQPVAT